MSLFPMEKISSDQLDDLVLVKLGFSQLWGRLSDRLIMGGLRGLGRLGMGSVRLAGRGMLSAARIFGNTAQRAGNAVVRHPGLIASAGAPAAIAVSDLPERFSKAQNNIRPENPYRY